MKNHSHSVDLFFSLALFFVFAFCALAVIVLGANVYRSSAASLGEDFSSRTALTYVQEKVRRNDAPGASAPFSQGEVSGLRVDSQLNGKTYRTYIYCWEGNLYELFLPLAREFTPEAGQRLVEVSSFTAKTAAPGLLEIACTDKDGNESKVSLCLRSEGGGADES